MTVRIVPLAPHHRAEWECLFAGYAAFYKVAQTEEMRATVWTWLMDPAHEVSCLIAETAEGKAIGLAHYRPMARPLAAGTAGFLDDLFVDPMHRGSGAADALLEALKGIAREKGWGVIRWLTADNNYRGRGVYDRHATRTFWITYEIKL